LADIEALSCVFRAGRKGALTDHDSILFNIDPVTSVILGGTTNANWYKLGLREALPGGCDWRSGDEEHVVGEHPDKKGKKVRGSCLINLCDAIRKHPIRKHHANLPNSSPSFHHTTTLACRSRGRKSRNYPPCWNYAARATSPCARTYHSSDGT
jgi:hypothetical protein